MLHFTERNPTALACVNALWLSRVQLFATPGTVACQTPLSMEFSRQKYWNGVSFPSPGDLPNTGIKLTSPALAGRFFTRVTWGAQLLFSSQQILFSKCKCDKFYLQSTQQTISSPETAYILCWHVLELIRVAKFMSHTRGHQQRILDV